MHKLLLPTLYAFYILTATLHRACRVNCIALICLVWLQYSSCSILLYCVWQLDLSDNRISNSLDALLGCPELEHISLSGNPIKELTTLEPLVC